MLKASVPLSTVLRKEQLSFLHILLPVDISCLYVFKQGSPEKGSRGHVWGGGVCIRRNLLACVMMEAAKSQDVQGVWASWRPSRGGGVGLITRRLDGVVPV